MTEQIEQKLLHIENELKTLNEKVFYLENKLNSKFENLILRKEKEGKNEILDEGRKKDNESRVENKAIDDVESIVENKETDEVSNNFEPRNVSDLVKLYEGLKCKRNLKNIDIRKKQKFDEIDSNEKTNDIEMVDENDEVVSENTIEEIDVE
jgi:hypothetical protein